MTTPLVPHSNHCRKSEWMLSGLRGSLDTERCARCRDLEAAERRLAADLGPRFAPHLDAAEMALRKRVEELEAERDEVAAGIRTGAVDVAALCDQARREGAEGIRRRIADALRDAGWSEDSRAVLSHAADIALGVSIDPPKAQENEACPQERETL
jgi:hypothetical protein